MERVGFFRNDNSSYVDTVKVLHQTVVSLRKALEQSKSEIVELKQRSWPIESLQEYLSTLAIENHILKNEILTHQKQSICGHSNKILKHVEKDRNAPKHVQISDEILKKDTDYYKSENSKTIATIPKVEVTDIDLNNSKDSGIKTKNLTDAFGKLKETKEFLKQIKKVEENLEKTEIRSQIEEEQDTVDITKISKKGKKELNLLEKNIFINTDNVFAGEIENQLTNFENFIQIQENTDKSKLSRSKKSQNQLETVSKNIKLATDTRNSSKFKIDQNNSGENFLLIVENISAQKFSTSLEDLNFSKNLRNSQKQKNLAVSKTVSFSNISDLRKIVKLYDKKLELLTLESNKNKMTEETTENNINNDELEEELFVEKTDFNPETTQELPPVEITQNDVVEENLPDDSVILNVSNEPKVNENSSLPPLPNFDDISQNSDFKTEEKSPIFEDSASTPSTIKERPSTLLDNESTKSNFFNKFKSVPSSNSNDIDQSEEVDDIELIFTTEETKEGDFKEELVPIESNENMLHLECPGNDTDNNLSFEMSDRELDDEVFNETTDGAKYSECDPQMFNSKSDTSINQEERSLKSCYSCQDSSFENRSFDKEESFDQFNEKVQIIETDISKCGITDVDVTIGRRNTCPNPLPYRPIIHRDTTNKGLNTRKVRPILGQSNASRRDSGAQTDITALPNTFWRSESSLAHKVKTGENFATLPSKLPLPYSRIKLSEKTVEARRILLSDIGFTSMVPELSRSADQLGPETLHPPPPTHYGQYLRAPDFYSPSVTTQKFNWPSTTSPVEFSRSGSHSRYNSVYPLSPPVSSSRRCSAPVSPNRRPYLKNISKVRFANGSLPELRADWISAGDSGDSTDSLVDEAECFLRRSIDCLSGKRDYYRIKSSRRASAPEACKDSIPLDWHPFLPRTPHDLRHEHWVKVIVPGDGKVRGGRVRYVGPVAGQTEQYIGVQLSTPDGHSDGVFHNRRYFSCEPHHAVFVPFKKVIMGWKP